MNAKDIRELEHSGLTIGDLRRTFGDKSPDYIEGYSDGLKYAIDQSIELTEKIKTRGEKDETH